jgi:hypothetical protein
LQPSDEATVADETVRVAILEDDGDSCTFTLMERGDGRHAIYMASDAGSQTEWVHFSDLAIANMFLDAVVSNYENWTNWSR